MKLSTSQLNKIKDITFRYDLHYKMWDWLSEHPEKTRSDYFKLYPGEKHLAGKYEDFACKYAKNVSNRISEVYGESKCKYCPLKGSSNGELHCPGDLFFFWTFAQGKDRIIYAKKIRDLKLNPMFNFKDAE